MLLFIFKFIKIIINKYFIQNQFSHKHEGLECLDIKNSHNLNDRARNHESFTLQEICIWFTTLSLTNGICDIKIYLEYIDSLRNKIANGGIVTGKCLQAKEPYMYNSL